jgi:hypothetical protein
MIIEVRSIYAGRVINLGVERVQLPNGSVAELGRGQAGERMALARQLPELAGRPDGGAAPLFRPGPGRCRRRA